MMTDPKRGEERDSDVSVISVDPSFTYLKTRFLERVAHDLRGPSGVALGALDEITASLASGDMDRVAPLLRIARRAQAKVLRVAEKLSRTAMMDQGNPFELGVVALTPLIERAAKAAESVEGRRAVKCTIDATLDPDQIRGDAGWLEMILTEVAADAISHARTEMCVSARRTHAGIVVEVTSDRARAAAAAAAAPRAERRSPGPRRDALARRARHGSAWRLLRGRPDRGEPRCALELPGSPPRRLRQLSIPSWPGPRLSHLL